MLEDTVFDRRVMRQGKEGINGLSFVVTGAVETFSNREELKKFIESQGGSVVSAISSKVDYLIMNNDVVDTVKRQKAEELGIEVITERRFNEMAQRTMQIEKILYNTKSVLKKYFGPGGDVVIPQTINEIKEMAFADCALITSIHIPDSVVHIGAYAFKNCTSLAGITIPSSIRNLNGSVFSGCTKLADADGFIILGNTFYGYVGEREKIEIPDTVQKIGAGAFRECMTVKSVTLPSSIHTIECEIFSGNKRLESIFIPDSVSSIGALTFAGCKKLKAFTIPDSVIVIGDLAFADCTALKCIAIPASVVQISATAFRGCKKLSLHAPAGSYAETYAKENNIPFVAE